MLVAEGFYFRPQSYYDSAAWRGTIELDGGVLMNQAIHTIDLLRWIGGPVAQRDRATSRPSATGMEAEDTATGEPPVRRAARWARSSRRPAPRRSARRSCASTASAATSDSSARTSPNGTVPEPRAAGRRRDGRRRRASPRQPRPGARTPSATSASTPTSSTRSASGRAPAVTADDGAAAVEIVLAAYESSRTGRAVELSGGLRMKVGAAKRRDHPGARADARGLRRPQGRRDRASTTRSWPGSSSPKAPTPPSRWSSRT